MKRTALSKVAFKLSQAQDATSWADAQEHHGTRTPRCHGGPRAGGAQRGLPGSGSSVPCSPRGFLPPLSSPVRCLQELSQPWFPPLQGKPAANSTLAAQPLCPPGSCHLGPVGPEPISDNMATSGLACAQEDSFLRRGWTRTSDGVPEGTWGERLLVSHAGTPAPPEALTAVMKDTHSFSTRQAPAAAGAGWPLSVMRVFL